MKGAVLELSAAKRSCSCRADRERFGLMGSGLADMCSMGRDLSTKAHPMRAELYLSPGSTTAERTDFLVGRCCC